MKKLLVLICGFLLINAAPALSVQIDWVDWTSSANGIAYGTLANGSIDVEFDGPFASVFTGSGTNYWTEPDPSNAPYTGNPLIDNAPTASEMIQLIDPGVATISFSEPVWLPVMAFVSQGSPNLELTYTFPGQILAYAQSGEGYWGNGVINNQTPDSFTGSELHGSVFFMGQISSITMEYAPYENWHGITFGRMAPIPEPATMALLGLGLIGLAGVSRRKQS